LKDKDQIQELFSKKLENFETEVNPALWEGIASKITSQTAVTSTGISVFVKTVVGVISVAVITTLVILGINASQESIKVTSVKRIKGEEQNKNNIAHERTSPVFAPTLSKTETEIALEKEQVADSPQKNTTTIEGAFSEEQQTKAVTKKNDMTGVLTQRKTQKKTENKRHASSPVSDSMESFVDKTVDNTKNKNQEQIKTTEHGGETKTTAITKMPNIFSPNNDGNNDLFFIESDELTDFNLIVLNNNNKTVFQSSNPKFKWNGLDINGLPIQKGRYVYFITATDLKGNRVNEYSHLIIR
tara:strand:- start:6325 stop:7224 length:900 start_codon:yes stop_codon:yes gene_type:complete